MSLITSAISILIIALAVALIAREWWASRKKIAAALTEQPWPISAYEAGVAEIDPFFQKGTADAVDAK